MPKKQYIHTESNHPPNIIKHIPASIENRLTHPLLKYYSKNQQYNTNIICDDLDTIRKKLTYQPTDTNQQHHSKHK